MKQLNIFNDFDKNVKKQKFSTWHLFVDGASRKNPGPSGAGIYIEKDGIVEIKEGYYLGIKTNNQAEYLALILGFFILEEHVHRDDIVHIVSDSQLLVRQLMGVYKVRHSHLQPLYALCKEKIQKLHATIAHVLRDENNKADAMANYGVDSKQNPPKHYIALLKHHDIVI